MHALQSIPTPGDLVGSVRRFGLTGPVYVVCEVVDGRNDEQASLLVEIPETGERVEVPYLLAIFDPTEDA